MSSVVSFTPEILSSISFILLMMLFYSVTPWLSIIMFSLMFLFPFFDPGCFFFSSSLDVSEFPGGPGFSRCVLSVWGSRAQAQLPGASANYHNSGLTMGK